jgi:hypothetical protein
MVPDAPWIEVHDDWLDDRLAGHDGYRAFQEYFSVRIKPDVINEYLMGNGILTATRTEMVRFSAQEKAGKLGVEATFLLTGATRVGGYGTDTVEIYRTIDLANKHCSFDKIGSSTVALRGFGVEYYRRAIPMLRKLGIEKIATMPTTGPEESPEKYRLAGAYIWSFYGYSNDKMPETLNKYIEYLRNVRKITLSPTEESAVLKLSRMRHLALDFKRGEQTGKKFLLGIDEHDKPNMAVWWNGTHRNINDESIFNEEMGELIKYLLSKIK